MRRRNARGTTLIFVLGILALLSLFAISFASMTRLERTASANYMDSVRADFVARAGLNAGVSTLRSSFRSPSVNPGQTPAPPTTPGGFMSCNDPWWYRGHALNSTASTPAMPLPGNGIPLLVAMASQDATKPALSLPLNTVAGDPLQASPPSISLGGAGNTLQISGTVGGTYVTKGDVFFLKILDCQGMLDANMNATDLQAALPTLGSEVLTDLTALSATLVADNILKQPIQTGYTVLDSILPLKTRPMGTTPASAYPSPFSQGAWVNAFINFRNNLPGGQFRSKDQIHAAFQAISVAAGSGPPGGEDQSRISQRGDDWYTLYRDFLSCWGEVDTNVVANGSSVTLPAHTVATSMASRRPVNLNTAPRSVLTTVIASIMASILDPAQIVEADNTADQVTVICNTQTIQRHPIRPYKHGPAPTVPQLSVSDARLIAQALVDYRVNTGPFRSWHDVYLCLNAQVGQGGLTNDKLAAALGGLCPCYLPLGWNPDRSLFYWDDVADPDAGTPLKVCVDKSGSTTIAEGCFNSGVFEIESLGRVYAGVTTPYVAGEASRRVVVQIGGTTWIRGQNDLAASVTDAVGAPEPSSFASGNKVGGWVQAQPATTGFLGGGWGGESSNKALESGGKVIADGFLAEREYGSNDTPHTDTLSEWQTHFFTKDNQPAWGSSDQGHFETWVKQPQDNTQGIDEGTNESFFVYTRGQQPLDRHAEPGQFTGGGMGEGGQTSSGIESAINGNVTDMGVGVRVEKYGNKLFVCRFFWGFPDGASPAVVGQPTVAGPNATGSNPTVPYDEMHRFVWSPSLPWKPGTWHHVYVSWSGMTINLYLDGVLAGSGADDPGVGQGYAWQSPTVPGFYPPGHPDETDRIAADQAIMDQQAAIMTNAQTAMNNASTAMNNDLTQMQALSPPTGLTPTGGAWPSLNNDRNQQQNTYNTAQTTYNTAQTAYNNANADRLAAIAEQGGNNSVWATDVSGMTFSAQAGLNKMKLRTFYPPLGGVDYMRYDLLGYHLGPGYGDQPYTTLTSLGTSGSPFKLQGTMFDRWCNGTFDSIVVDSTTNAPSQASTYRFGTTPGTVNLALTFPGSYVVRSFGFMPILAHAPTNACGVSALGTTLSGNDRLGDGRQVGGATGYTGGYSLTFTPGDHLNVTPWALAGVWVGYEMPTAVLEGGVEVDGT